MQEKNIDFQSNRLKAYRIKKNLSQKELAEMLGVARNYVYLIESGRKPITESIEEKLSMLENSEIKKIDSKSIDHVLNFEKRLSSIETLLIQVLSELRKKKET